MIKNKLYTVVVYLNKFFELVYILWIFNCPKNTKKENFKQKKMIVFLFITLSKIHFNIFFFNNPVFNKEISKF